MFPLSPRVTQHKPNQNMKITTLPKTITAKQASEEPIFFAADWKYEGRKITAIHSGDESTRAEFAKYPEGYVMISTVGKATRDVVSPDTNFTL
jgi:hypothetical protein